MKPYNGINAIPTRIQRNRKHKQVSPNGLPIVYVGRPSKWGNPFIIGIYSEYREDCLRAYNSWLNGKSNIEYYQSIAGTPPTIEEIKLNLKGKNLSCWCRGGEYCHADTLLKIANE